MDFFEVIIRNKRYKDFLSDQSSLTSDQIKQLMACAQLSPSLSDIQNFTFVLVTDNGLIHQLSSEVENGGWMVNSAGIFAVVVVIDDTDDVNIIDAIISSSQLMLAATSVNLGCNLVVDFSQDAVNQLLGITDQRLTVIALIPIGNTDAKGSQGYKRTLAELLHHNQFGQPFEFE